MITFRRITSFFILSLLLTCSSFAQDAANTEAAPAPETTAPSISVDERLVSPRETMRTFLQAFNHFE